MKAIMKAHIAKDGALYITSKKKFKGK